MTFRDFYFVGRIPENSAFGFEIVAIGAFTWEAKDRGLTSSLRKEWRLDARILIHRRLVLSSLTGRMDTKGCCLDIA